MRRIAARMSATWIENSVATPHNRQGWTHSTSLAGRRYAVSSETKSSDGPPRGTMGERPQAMASRIGSPKPSPR